MNEREAFLQAHPLVTLEVCLSDRLVALLEEGIDVALRIGLLASHCCLVFACRPPGSKGPGHFASATRTST